MMRQILLIATCSTLAAVPAAGQDRGIVTVTGQVTDVATGDGVAGAVIELVSTSFRAITNARGQFEIRDVVTGDHTLRVQHIGYGTRTQQITVPRTRRLDVDVRLDPKPITVTGIQVTVLSEEERRLRSSAGRFSVVTEPHIDRAAGMGRRVADVLRHELGLRVREGTFVTPESLGERPERILCVESGRGRTRLQNPIVNDSLGMKQFCEMVQLYVDDVRLGNAGNYLMSIDLNHVARIEYMSPNEASVKYGLAAADNGVLLFFMKKR